MHFLLHWGKGWPVIKTTMRRKVTAILHAPVPGTKALERRLVRWLVASVKFTWWSLPGVVALLAVWIVGGNFWAAQQEKEVERAWEEFAQDWPELEMNDSALKLAELASDLGINLGTGASYRSAVMADTSVRILILPSLRLLLGGSRNWETI